MRTALANVFLALVLAMPATASSAVTPQGGDGDSTARYRDAIAAMKSAPKGPFARIRWFCADGSVLPPEPFACREHGGGRQHGEWTDVVKRMRADGYPIANVFAALAPEDFGDDAWRRLLPFLLAEQYLIGADDGWIFRRARYYRGAVQAEAEAAGANRILVALAAGDDWREERFPLLYEAVRQFPAESAGATAGEVRALATGVHERDAAFGALRNKIHNRLELADAAAVRRYAATRRQGGGAVEDLEALAARIEELFERPAPAPLLRRLAPPGADGDLLRAIADRVESAAPVESIALLADAMALIRDRLAAFGGPAARVAALRVSVELETQIFGLAQHALPDGSSRGAVLGLLSSLARAVYGSGLLTRFESTQFAAAITAIGDAPDLAAWRDAVAYVERLPGWAQRRLAFYLELPMADLAAIEPRAAEYIPDRLRGSPLLAYSQWVERLAADVAGLSGVRHEMFGRESPTGLRALNPGLAAGVVRTLEDLAQNPGEGDDSIVIVPETVAELPPVAGILTANEGNVLSHVQLLARNLGVPNVVVGPAHMPRLMEHRGRRAALAVSPGGVVRLTDEPPATATAQDELDDRLRIRIEPQRLDLETRRMFPTSELSPADSGVRVGPKAAQLGKLTRVFPEHVSPGLAIPFGVFRDFLDQPREPGGSSAFDWMRASYGRLAAITDRAERARETSALLAEIRAWIASAPMDPEFLKALRTGLQQAFGPDGSFGVFVRSDTNVEDLPGFTGAGLNLTVHNVVGYEGIVDAIRQVWASPFTDRAYGWRQALMDQPEHVYVSVLLHQSVNNDVSGVLITADATTGSRDFLSVVANEGVGGGVEGQSAESLRVLLGTGELRLLSSATAPRKRVLLPEGGSALVYASGRERLLREGEIDQLMALTSRLPGWFEQLPPDEQLATVADVEYGFHDGRLMLFQIRPFVQNRAAGRSEALRALDAPLAATAGADVSLESAPLAPLAGAAEATP